ncbi:MAG: hypothetical protein SCARUB_05076 [Candidatus Scalindua rubra]|uniref:Uncharacterized protein n=1 Tax=Candidatus Scalindua rubra TaxID=1872076 RepID=A0A1E3X296_9BACT|nr:MAG: hypothetical protein SCARUB_05076 [Candidatus Scalindua rubra]
MENKFTSRRLARIIIGLFNVFGLITILYLIGSGFKIKPNQGLFSTSFWPVLVALWVLAPRNMPFLWLLSIPAFIWTWVVYIILGCILVPRMTWGFILLWHIPSTDIKLAWIVIVLSFFMDIMEDMVLLKRRPE